MCGLDLETTSADPEVARIVTGCVVRVGAAEGRQRPVDAWTVVVDPGVEIPEEAAAVHGYTTERARAEGMPAPAALEAIMGEVAKAVSARTPIVVMHASYDFTVLERELHRHGMTELADMLGEALVIDPRVIDRWVDKYRAGKRTLADLCAHYGASLDGAHDATFDAIAACRVAWRLLRCGGPVRRVRNQREAEELDALRREWRLAMTDPVTLHEAQQRWADADRLEFVAWLRSQPPREDGLDPDIVFAQQGWPIRRPGSEVQHSQAEERT